MILLDTHVWLWLVAGDPRLTQSELELLAENERAGLGVSIMSCWEVAKKVEQGKLELDRDVAAWISAAIVYPGVQLLDLTPAIVVESTRLPTPFHRDPADQLIVATSRVLDIPLVTHDGKLRAYPHVEKVVLG